MSAELEAESAAVEALIEVMEAKLSDQRLKVWREEVILSEMTSDWKDLVLRLGRLRRGLSDGNDSRTASGSD